MPATNSDRLSQVSLSSDPGGRFRATTSVRYGAKTKEMTIVL